MNPVRNLFCSTIGRKFLMALTGVVLIGFVFGHLVGNLQVFEDPDRINGYAHFLQSLGPALWVARIVLLICVGIHVWAATVLTLESRKARGTDYAVSTWLQATFASRYMRWTGYVVLAFIVYHLAHFTVGVVQPGTFKTNLPPYTMHGDYHILGLTVVRAGTHGDPRVLEPGGRPLLHDRGRASLLAPAARRREPLPDVWLAQQRLGEGPAPHRCPGLSRVFSRQPGDPRRGPHRRTHPSLRSG